MVRDSAERRGRAASMRAARRVSASTARSTCAILVERARALHPLLSRNAAATDRERRIPEENIDALAEAGLLSLGIPARFGGLEAPIRTQLEVSAALGEACGSTGWVAQNINAAEVVAGMFADSAQQEVWGENPCARVVGSQAPTDDVQRVDGGWEISGRWPWLSGSYHADWAFLGFPLAGSPGERRTPAFGLVPLSAGRIEDTWFVTGMRGTCSNTLVLEKVFVPDHRVLEALSALEGKVPTEHVDEALYQSALGPVLILILVGSQIGLARAALSIVREKAPKRAISYTSYASQSESVGFQIQVGEAAVQIEAARLLALDAADRIDQTARAGERMPYDERVRVRTEAAWVCRQLRRAVGDLVDAHGASTFAEANPLQRVWRDLNAAARHAMLTTQVGFELLGKELLGRDERISALI
jgi:3-hydroxy-9,10-secoandrosta-1,3,5(10)-triene-9,17-dione monooxygenase